MLPRVLFYVCSFAPAHWQSRYRSRKLLPAAKTASGKTSANRAGLNGHANELRFDYNRFDCSCVCDTNSESNHIEPTTKPTASGNECFLPESATVICWQQLREGAWWSCALTSICAATLDRITEEPPTWPILHKRLTSIPTYTGTSSLVEPRRLMTPFVGTLLLLLLSPVSSKTSIASKCNSPPGAPAYTHCVAILKLDVPLLEHVHTGGQDNVDRRGA